PQQEIAALRLIAIDHWQITQIGIAIELNTNLRKHWSSAAVAGELRRQPQVGGGISADIDVVQIGSRRMHGQACRLMYPIKNDIPVLPPFRIVQRIAAAWRHSRPVARIIRSED